MRDSSELIAQVDKVGMLYAHVIAYRETTNGRFFEIELDSGVGTVMVDADEFLTIQEERTK